MTPKQKEAWNLSQQGLSIRQTAKKLGISKTSVFDRLAGAKAYLSAGEGIQSAMANAGIHDINQLHSGWLKTDEASLYFVQPKQSSINQLTDIIDVIKDKMTDIHPAPTLTKPNFILKKMLTIYPIADAHFGMRGEGYDLDVAKKRMRQGIQQCITGSLRAEECLSLIHI